MSTAVRVVIDTNIFITILKKGGKNRWMFDRILSGEWVLCLTNEIFLEYWEILETKTNKTVASNVIDFLISHPHVLFVSDFFKLNLITADADDNKFCDCCFAASAGFIITSDNHFNILKEIEFPKIQVFTSDEIKNYYNL